MTDQPDIQAALRASLAERARHAPPGGPVAQRVIADVERLPGGSRSPRRRDPRWRAWTLPLVAAGSVAAVAAALVGANQFRHNAAPDRPVAPATSHLPTPSAQPPTPSQPAPTTIAPSPAAPGPSVLTNFRATDLTFVSDEHGWALGSADCLNGTGTCSAMERTTDGGKTWQAVRNPPANVGEGCAAGPCVAHLRFANDQIGYAYGQAALFMTTDGGATWRQEPGGAEALETLDGNVIRLVSDHSGCPGPCNLRVQLAPIGSAGWNTVTLPGGVVDAGSVSLARTGSHAFVEVYTGHAGSSTPAPLYTSSDDGQSWTRRADPCAQFGGTANEAPTVTRELTTAADGSLSVLCRDGNSQVIATSADAGAHFASGPRFTLGASGIVGELAAPSNTVVLVAAGDGVYRSTDRGQSWRRVIADASSGGGSCSFGSLTVGRCVSNDHRTIWTTRDAGLTWSADTFS
jgi:photosystem II stability/assembly factor-like uncharacterized protein